MRTPGINPNREITRTYECDFEVRHKSIVTRTGDKVNEGFCPYCGELLTAATSCVDHIMPLARGGPDISTNKIRVCRSCNAEKGDRLLFVEWTPPSCTVVEPNVDDETDFVWSQLVLFKVGCQRKLTSDRKVKLVSAIRRHGVENLLRVAKWLAESRHPRATFVRLNCDVDTILRKQKLQAYVDMSKGPDVDPRALAAFARWRALSGQPDEPTPALVAPILAAIEQIGEPDTLAVIEWVLTGTDDKARFLQTKNVRSIQAVLNPDKLHGRRDLARAAKPVRIGDRPAVTPTTATGSPEADDGVNLGPNAFLGYSPTDHLRRTRKPPPT